MFQHKKLFLRLSILLFIIYLLILTWIITFKCNSYIGIMDSYLFMKDKSTIDRFLYSILPFKNHVDHSIGQSFFGLFYQDILNIIVFVPFGLFLSSFLKKNIFVKVLISSFMLSLLYEGIQLITIIGFYDTTDLITNTLGGCIGYLIFRLLNPHQNNITKLKIFNILMIIIITISLPIVIYSIINTIKNIDLYIDVLWRNI